MRALITGSTSGIGAACVLRFAGEGWSVLDVARTSKHYPCDVTDKAALAKVIVSVPTLDAIIHCAYTYEEAQVQRVGQDALEVLWTYGQGGLRAGNGALVVLSSIAAKDPDTPYGLDKRAQERRAMAFAREGAPDVRVNIVRPHLIGGTRTHKVAEPKRAEHLPLQRYGTPEEVAEVVWLAATCRHMTGATITVDGGHSICAR